MQHLGRWHDATATIHDMAAAPPRELTVYQRIGELTARLDPKLVRVTFTT